MPGGIFSGGVCNFVDEGTSAPAGTVITTGVGVNVKGSYTQLVASTPNDASGFWLTLANSSSSSNPLLVDLALGASGSEVVIIPNIPFGLPSGFAALFTVYVPCAIPAGSRISARAQVGSASAGTITVQVILADGNASDIDPYGGPQNYGAVTSTSLGTPVDPGATANTKGAWAQITASTIYDIAAIQIIFDSQKGLDNAQNLVDIGVGASGSEIVIIPNLQVTGGIGSVNCNNNNQPLFRKKIPAGSRISARCQSTQTATGNRKVGVTILGYPQ